MEMNTQQQQQEQPQEHQQIEEEYSMTSLSRLLDTLEGPIDLCFHKTELLATEAITDGTTFHSSSTRNTTTERIQWTAECRDLRCKKRQIMEEKLTEDQFMDLLRKVSCKPNFRHLRLSSDGSEIPLQAILFAAWTSSLETFSVTRGITVHHRTLELLVGAFQNHSSLKSVCLYDLALPTDTGIYINRQHKNHPSSSSTATTTTAATTYNNEEEEAFLDPLIQALATIPNLECVDASIQTTTLEEDRTKKNLISPAALAKLLSTPPMLEEVSLWNWSLTDDHIMHGMVPSLLRQQTMLQFLSLRQNPAISQDGWDWFYTHVLADNYTLQHVVRDAPCTSDSQLQGQFQLQLNNQDRGAVLLQQDPAAWCDCLANSYGNDLDALYYWMRQANPVLIVASMRDSR